MWLSARLRGSQWHMRLVVEPKEKGQTRRSSPVGKCLQGSRHLYYGLMSELDHSLKQRSKITLCYTQHLDCSRCHKYLPEHHSARLAVFYTQWEHHTYFSKMSLQVGLETAASGAAINSSRQLVSSSCAVVRILLTSSDTLVFFSGSPKAATMQLSYSLP